MFWLTSAKDRIAISSVVLNLKSIKNKLETIKKKHPVSQKDEHLFSNYEHIQKFTNVIYLALLPHIQIVKKEMTVNALTGFYNNHFF